MISSFYSWEVVGRHKKMLVRQMGTIQLIVVLYHLLDYSEESGTYQGRFTQMKSIYYGRFMQMKRIY